VPVGARHGYALEGAETRLHTALRGPDDVEALDSCVEDQQHQDDDAEQAATGQAALAAAATATAVIAGRAALLAKEAAEFLLQVPDYLVEVRGTILLAAAPGIAFISTRFIPGHRKLLII